MHAIKCFILPIILLFLVPFLALVNLVNSSRKWNQTGSQYNFSLKSKFSRVLVAFHPPQQAAILDHDIIIPGNYLKLLWSTCRYLPSNSCGSSPSVNKHVKINHKFYNTWNRELIITFIHREHSFVLLLNPYSSILTQSSLLLARGRTRTNRAKGGSP